MQDKRRGSFVDPAGVVGYSVVVHTVNGVACGSEQGRIGNS